MEKASDFDMPGGADRFEKKIVSMSISKIKPYPKNPRINDDAVDKVAASIKEFGFKNPIIVDKNMVIIAGHTRLKAAKKLKLKSAPVIVADDLSNEQVRAFRLADNKTAELSSWSNNLLSEELEDIQDFDMSAFGFDYGVDCENELDLENETEHSDHECVQKYIVVIDCEDENEQEAVYDKLLSEGYNCRVLM